MSFGGFNTGTAAAAPAFGAAPATGGGFGTAAPAPAGAGGFGAAATPATGFGAKPATTGGFGFGGGTTAAPAAGTGGFGAAPATSGGFGATGAATGGGFGAQPASATPAFGTAGAGRGFGAPTATPGFGAGRGGFGIGSGTTGGFGTMGTAATAAANAAPTAAQFPYPGIKGPGNAMSWAREVDFSQVMDQTPFESLPQPLQQHLMELRSFMHAERDATKKVYEYLNETEKAAPSATAGAAAGSAGGSSGAATASYRRLLSQLAVLKGSGNQAVEIVAVHCNQHEGQARRQLQRMEKLEAHVRDYERHVWEPLVEQGLPLSSGSSGLPGARGQLYRPAATSDAASPFIALVEELSRRLEDVSKELTELEATLVPPGRPLRGAGAVERPGHRGGPSIPSDAIAQINASLLYELNQLRDFSCVAAHLHSRTDTARHYFTRRYGQAEADVLFADTEAQRNGLAVFRRAPASSYFDIPPLPQQPQPQTSLPTGAPASGGFGTAAPATTGFGTTTTTTGGFGAAPASATATGGFGAPAPSTTGGFGAASPAGASTAASGGFGAKPAATADAATGGSGFGFGAAPTAATAPPTTATAAPATAGGFGAAAAPAATGGFGAPAAATAAPATAPAAPAMGPASPAGAPTSFSLGGSATGSVGFGFGPGKTAADGEERPARRAR